MLTINGARIALYLFKINNAANNLTSELIDGACMHHRALASYAPKDTKIGLLSRTISRVDLLKLLLQLAWDVRALDTKKYVTLSEELDEVGRMLGGWKKGLQSKTPIS